MVDRVLDRGLDEAGGAFLGDGLDADAGGFGEADLLEHVGEIVGEEFLDFDGVVGAVLELDAGVDVLGVFSEDDHVGLLGVLDGGGDAREVADGAEAGVEVEDLAEGDIEGADAAACGGGKGALDADEVLGEVVEGGLGEPFAGGVVGFVARHDLVPVDLALAVVGLLDRGVEDELGGVPDVGACAVALDEGDDGMVGDLEAVGGHGDGGGGGGGGHLWDLSESGRAESGRARRARTGFWEPGRGASASGLDGSVRGCAVCGRGVFRLNGGNWAWGG